MLHIAAELAGVDRSVMTVGNWNILCDEYSRYKLFFQRCRIAPCSTNLGDAITARVEYDSNFWLVVSYARSDLMGTFYEVKY